MKKGFTIIELLVVVAIIAILTSIAVIGYDVARNRSANSSIKATLGQVRAESLIYAQESEGFTGLCSAGEPYGIAAMLSEVGAQSFVEARCFADDSAWVAASLLRGGDATEFAWCVDSNNFGGVINSSRYSAILSANSLNNAGVLCQ